MIAFWLNSDPPVSPVISSNFVKLNHTSAEFTIISEGKPALHGDQAPVVTNFRVKCVASDGSIVKVSLSPLADVFLLPFAATRVVLKCHCYLLLCSEKPSQPLNTGSTFTCLAVMISEVWYKQLLSHNKTFLQGITVTRQQDVGKSSI